MWVGYFLFLGRRKPCALRYLDDAGWMNFIFYGKFGAIRAFHRRAGLVDRVARLQA
jgi:hypothetical protein